MGATTTQVQAQAVSKRDKVIYWAVTGLFSAMMLMSASMYIANYGEMVQNFNTLDFPAFIIYPLAAAKILGVVAILTKKSATLKEWAYAGFFFNILLAAGAHLNAGDGQVGGAAVVLVLLLASYLYDEKAFGRS